MTMFGRSFIDETTCSGGAPNDDTITFRVLQVTDLGLSKAGRSLAGGGGGRWLGMALAILQLPLVFGR